MKSGEFFRAVEIPVRAISIFQELCEEIRRVIYYGPKKLTPFNRESPKGGITNG